MIDAFAPRDRVYIPEIDKTGVVIQVTINGRGIEYEVRYFDSNEARTEWFFDFEVSRPSASNKETA